MIRHRGIQTVLIAALLAGLLWAQASNVHAWGPIGHQIIAQIAELRLSAKAREAIKKILGDEQFTNEVLVVWADNIRIERKETGPWHYVNIPVDAKEYNPERDGKAAKPGDPKVDVIERINFFTGVLKDANAKPELKNEALKFIIHFVGDLHQPLHCVDRNDRGGNSVVVQYLKDEKPINLHKAWDIELVKAATEQDPQVAFAKRSNAAVLNDSIKAEDAEKWAKGEVKDWALESHDVGVESVYAGVPKEGVFTMDEAYIKKSKPVIELQFQRGGVRLAALLNKIFE